MGHGFLAASADGADWTVWPAPTSVWLWGLAPTDGGMLVVGEAGYMAFKADGGEWTEISSRAVPDLGATITSITHHDGDWVGVGSGDLVVRSTDGQQWRRGSTGHPSGSLESVRWLGDAYWAVGWAGTVLRSPDGDQWDVVLEISGTEFYDIAAHGATIVAVGWRSGSPEAETLIATRLPASDWVLQDVPGLSRPLRSVAWSGREFVAVGNLGLSLVSSDGIAWERSHAPGELTRLATNGEVLVGVGPGSLDGVITARPADETAWHVVHYPSDGAPVDVAWDGRRFVAAGRDLISTSADGFNWREEPLGVGLAGVTCVTGNGGQIVIAGNGANLVSATHASVTPRQGSRRLAP